MVLFMLISRKTTSINDIDSTFKWKTVENILLFIISAGILLRLVLFLFFGARFILDYVLIFVTLFLFMYIYSKLGKKDIFTYSKKKKIRDVLAILLLVIFYLDTYIAVRDIQTIVSETEETKVVSYDITDKGRRYFTTFSEDVSEKDTIATYTVSKGKIVEDYLIDVKTGAIVKD